MNADVFLPQMNADVSLFVFICGLEELCGLIHRRTGIACIILNS